MRTETEARNAANRAVFLDALDEYLSAREQYNDADPEWRSGQTMYEARDRLEESLKSLLE